MAVSNDTAASQPNANRLVKAAAVVSTLTIASKLLGFGREAVLAAVFGASKKTDAYLTALVMPNILFALVGTVVTTVAVPVITTYVIDARKRRDFADLLWTSLNVVSLTAALLAVLGVVFAGPLTKLVAPGLEADTLTLASSLSRVLTPVVVILVLIGWLSGVLNAHQQFAAPAAGGLPFNLVIIASLFLARAWGTNIYVLAWGTVLAYSTQVLIQLPSLLKVAPRYRVALNWTHPGLKQMGRLAVPVLVGVGASQLNMVFERILASGLSPGSISALSYAQKTLTLPTGLLGTPIVTVLYPVLAGYRAKENHAAFRNALNRGVTALTMVMLPVLALFLTMREDLVRFLYQRGAFTATDTQRTALALSMYGASLIFLVWRDYLIRASYAIQDSWTPLWTGLLSAGVNIALNVLLIHRMGMSGLALSSSVGTAVNAVLLLGLLRRRLGPLGGKRMIREGVKMVISCGVMTLGLHVMIRYGTVFRPTFVGLGLRLVVFGIIGGIIYIGTSHVLGVEDLAYLGTAVRRLIHRFFPRFRSSG